MLRATGFGLRSAAIQQSVRFMYGSICVWEHTQSLRANPGDQVVAGEPAPVMAVAGC